MPASEFYDGTFTATAIIVILCSAEAVYNALELVLLIFTTFKAYRGLYFWSLVVATTGVLPYTLGVVVIYFRLTSLIGGLVLLNYGWFTMVTGQSVVLYSRLGIVLGEGYHNVLHAVKWMIVVDAIVLHLTTLVVSIGNWFAPNPRPWQLGYKYMEKIQMTMFCVQEFIISGLYVWKALEIIRTVTTDKRRTHRIMWQLFVINVIIICFDVALLVIEYLELRFDEFAFKALVYSVKLKLEFAILGQLVKYSGVKVNDQAMDDGMDFDLTLDAPKSDNIKYDSNLRGSTAHKHSIFGIEKGTAEHIETDQIHQASSTHDSQTSQSVVDESKATGTDYAYPLEQKIRKDSGEDLYADAIRSISHAN